MKVDEFKEKPLFQKKDKKKLDEDKDKKIMSKINK